jgi:hypothetical protein
VVQAADYYTAALRHADSPAMEAAGLDRSWPITLRFQIDFFNAAAQLYQSEATKEAALEAGAGFGEEITRLRLAQTLLERALESANRYRMGPAIINKADQLKSRIIKNRTEAEKDNNTIYLESVPPESSLKPIAKANMVKVPQYELPPLEAPLFSRLLPKAVKESLAAFARDAQALVASAESDGKDASRQARQQLNAAGLPGSLESHESPGGLPEPCWKKIQGLRDKESSPAELAAQAQEVQTQANRVGDLFLKIDKALQDEDDRDARFRAQWGEAWEKVGVPSATLQADTRKELAHFQGLYADARKSDEYLLGRLGDPDFTSIANLLASSRGELDTLLAKPRRDDAPVVDTRALSGKMRELAMLLQERDGLVASLKQSGEASKEALKARLLTQPDVPAEQAIAEALAPVQGVRAQVAASISRQGPIVAQILAENERFQAARQADRVTLERDALIQQLETGIVRCHEIHAQLTEGKSFYNTISKRLQQLQQLVEDQSYTQEVQRRDFLDQSTRAAQRRQQEESDMVVAQQLFDQVGSRGAMRSACYGA